MAKSGKCTITQNSQSTVNNTSNITVKCIITTSDDSWRGDFRKGTLAVYQGSTLIYQGEFQHGAPQNATTELFSVTLTVNHKSDGSSVTITASYNYDNGWCTGTGSMTPTTIKRASVPTLSATSVEFGKTITITTNRKSDSFTHHLYYSINGGTETGITSGIGASYTWTVPLTLMNNIPNATSATIKFRLYTFSGSTNIGSNTVTFTATVPNTIVPSVTIAVSDAMGYADKYGAYIQSKSKAKIVLTASGSYKSTIKSYSTSFDGKKYTASSVTTDAISGSGTLTISVTVKDSRGRSATASAKITVLAYSVPQITNLSVVRCDENGNAEPKGAYLSVSFSSSIKSLNSKNSAAYTVQYKKKSDADYTVETLDDCTGKYTVDATDILIFSAESSGYDVVVVAQDDFETIRKSATGPPARARFGILLDAWGMALGKIAELEGVLDIAFQTRFEGGILHPVLTDGTDVNDVMTPNTYIALDSYNYTNLPATGAGVLEVVGTETTVVQSFRVISKTAPKTYERAYYSGSWGAWVDLDENVKASLGDYVVSYTKNDTDTIRKRIWNSGFVEIWERGTATYANTAVCAYHLMANLDLKNINVQCSLMSAGNNTSSGMRWTVKFQNSILWVHNIQNDFTEDSEVLVAAYITGHL